MWTCDSVPLLIAFVLANFANLENCVKTGRCRIRFIETHAQSCYTQLPLLSCEVGPLLLSHSRQTNVLGSFFHFVYFGNTCLLFDPHSILYQ